MRASVNSLRRVLTAGMVLLVALLVGGTAQAHGSGHAAVGHAISPLRCLTGIVGDRSRPVMVQEAATQQAVLDPSPCCPGHGARGHAGCCAGSPCPIAGGALLPAAVLLPSPSAVPISPASAAERDGVRDSPGDRPPRHSV
jgi:hypothetical protein